MKAADSMQAWRVRAETLSEMRIEVEKRVGLFPSKRIHVVELESIRRCEKSAWDHYAAAHVRDIEPDQVKFKRTDDMRANAKVSTTDFDLPEAACITDLQVCEAVCDRIVSWMDFSDLFPSHVCCVVFWAFERAESRNFLTSLRGLYIQSYQLTPAGHHLLATKRAHGFAHELLNAIEANSK